MSMEVSSNLEQVIQRLHERASRMSSEYTAVLFNNVSYASAVENGYTRTLRWADMSKEQRGAIFASMKKREKQGARQDSGGPKASVQSFDGGFTITMPPAGMVANNIAAIRKYGEQQLAEIAAFHPVHFKAFLADVAEWALVKIVLDTPVDQSVLRRGWDVRFV